MKDYNKLNKKKLLEALKEADKTLEILESELSQKDASLGALLGEKDELLSKIDMKDGWLSIKNTECLDLSVALSEAKSGLLDSEAELKRITDTELAEHEALVKWKSVAALETLIIVILIITLITILV